MCQNDSTFKQSGSALVQWVLVFWECKKLGWDRMF